MGCHANRNGHRLRRGWAGIWAGALFGALGWTACQPEPAPTRGRSLGSGVLIIEIDAWRRDRLSLYGHEHATTPALEQWCREAVVFEDVWSTGSGVLPATASLLGGCDSVLSHHPGIAMQDGAVVPAAFPWQLPGQMPLLAFQFLAQGWRTGLFDGTGQVNELRGVHVGFETLNQSGVPGSDGAETLDFVQLQNQWSAWLRTLHQGDDWFAYWHVADLERFHAVDAPPEAFPRPEALDFQPPLASVDPAFHALPRARRSPHLASLADYSVAYDEALLELDRALQGLFQRLEEERLLGRTTIILVGGYGMGFGESGLFADAGSLSEAELAVPLIVRPARDLGLSTGQRVAGLVSLVDVAPTALDLAGVPVPDGWQGRSLLPLWREGRAVRSEAFALAPLHEGFAVIDAESLLARSYPWKSEAHNLGLSWSGHAGPEQDPIENLWARGESLQPYAYRKGVPQGEGAANRSGMGERWMDWGTRWASRIHRFARPIPGSDLPSSLPDLPWAR